MLWMLINTTTSGIYVKKSVDIAGVIKKRHAMPFDFIKLCYYACNTSYAGHYSVPFITKTKILLSHASILKSKNNVTGGEILLTAYNGNEKHSFNT